MKEYIGREAATKAAVDYLWIGFPLSTHGLTKAINNVPAADVVEVVRCKECRSLYDGADDYCCIKHKGLVTITPDSFCSYGERRADT